MRSSSTQGMLAYEASRKPIVADLVERAALLTEEEINAAPVLPWIRNAVRAMREAHREAQRQRELMAALALAEHRTQHAFLNGVTPDPEGAACMWNGDNEWIMVNARGSQVEIKYNDLIWVSDQGGVWIDTVFVEKPQPAFLNRLILIQRTSMSGYQTLRQERLQRHYLGDNLPVIDLTGGKASEPMSRLGSLGVRIGPVG